MPACTRSTPAPTSPTSWAAPMPCAWPVTDDMKNPRALPARHRQGLLRRRRRRRRARRHPTRSPTTRSRRSTSSTTRYEAVTDLEDALSDRVVIHDELGTNSSYTWNLLDRGDRRRRRAGLRQCRPHRQRALRPAAADPDGDGTACRRRRAAAVRRRHHAVLGHPDPPHPQGDDRGHARHPRAPDPRGRTGRRRRVRLQAQRVRRGAAVRGAGPQARHARCAGTRRARRTPWRPSRAAGRSRTSSWPPTPTASSPRCGCASSPTWAPTCSWSRPASRCSARSSTPACTTCPRRTTSRAPRCSPR